MPRNGSGVYSQPVGTSAVSGEKISSSKFNSLVTDLVTDANAARPVVAGGTGGTSQATAQQGLGVEVGVDVLAYDADLDAATDAMKGLISGDLEVIGDASVTDGSIDQGFYTYSTTLSSTGGPSGSVGGILGHFKRANREVQIFIEDNPSITGKTYTRMRPPSSPWEDWSTHVNSGDGLPPEFYATYAESIDGTKSGVVSSPLRVKQAITAHAHPACFFEGRFNDTTDGDVIPGDTATILKLDLASWINISGVALSSNQITGLPAGDYQIEASAMVSRSGESSDVVQLWVYDETGAATLVIGERARTDLTATSITAFGRFTLSATSTISIRAKGDASFTNGCGRSETLGLAYVANRLKLWQV